MQFVIILWHCIEIRARSPSSATSLCIMTTEKPQQFLLYITDVNLSIVIEHRIVVG